MDSLNLFWQEMRSYFLVYCLYALIVLVVTVFLERAWQQSSVPLSGLLSANGLVLAGTAAWLLVAMFVSAYAYRWLGGEIPAVVLVTLVGIPLLAFLNVTVKGAWGIGFASPWLGALVLGGVLYLPFVGVWGFTFALGSGYQN